MHEVLASHDVQVVALSSDTIEAARAHGPRDGLRHVQLLADPELSAIAALGLVHPRGWPFVTKTIGGIPVGYPVRPRRLGLPTSILVDADGTVRWIDRADDYRMRGDRARIEGALRDAFGR